MGNVRILKVKPENVRPMKVVDMYVTKGIGGILNYKYVRTYFKLVSNEGNDVKLTEVFFDVPVQDIQSKRVRKGSVILVEQFPRGLKYLGADGDWETMLNFGISPDIRAEFGTFSEEGFSISYEEEDSSDNSKTVIIRVNGKLVTELRFLNGELVKKLCKDTVGEKLANDWLTSRGYKSDYELR